MLRSSLDSAKIVRVARRPLVEFLQKRSPRLGNSLSQLHGDDFPPSYPSADSNAPLPPGGFAEASFSPLPSANRGRAYLPLPDENGRVPRRVPAASGNASGRST